jgi:hypothetical protein
MLKREKLGKRNGGFGHGRRRINVGHDAEDESKLMNLKKKRRK